MGGSGSGMGDLDMEESGRNGWVGPGMVEENAAPQRRSGEA